MEATFLMSQGFFRVRIELGVLRAEVALTAHRTDPGSSSCWSPVAARFPTLTQIHTAVSTSWLEALNNDGHGHQDMGEGLPLREHGVTPRTSPGPHLTACTALVYCCAQIAPGNITMSAEMFSDLQGVKAAKSLHSHQTRAKLEKRESLTVLINSKVVLQHGSNLGPHWKQISTKQP